MSKIGKKLSCAYCGSDRARSADHVIPRALYPASKSVSRVKRVTVPACQPCNNGWSRDEAHFRNVLLVSGETTPLVRELWTGKTRRSFKKCDGGKQLLDLVTQLVPVQRPEGDRHMIYPGRDPRVMRIVRKVIRGLCHHHGLLSPVSDLQVWADVQQFMVPPEFEALMTVAHAEEDVLHYRFAVLAEPEQHSCWVLRFFDRTAFFGVVYQSEEARAQMEAAVAEG